MANTAKQVTLIEATIDIKVGRSAAAFNSLTDSLEKIAGNNGLLESTVAGFSLLNATLAEGSSQYESFAKVLSNSKKQFKDIKKSIDGAVAGFGKIAGAKEAVFDPTPSQLSNLEDAIRKAIRKGSADVNLSFDIDSAIRNLQAALLERRLKVLVDADVVNLDATRAQIKEKETSPFTKRGGLSTGTQQEKAVRSILIKELQKADFSAEKLDATIKEITDSLRNLGGANTQVDQVTKALAQLFRRSLQAKVSLDELNEADKFTALTTLGRSAREFLKEFESALSKADTLKVKAIASFEELAEKGGGSFSKLNKTAQKTISAMYKELVGSSIIPDGNKAILENFSKSFRRIYAILQGFSKDTLSKFKVLYENITTFTKYRFDEPITSLKNLNRGFLRLITTVNAISTIGTAGFNLVTPFGQASLAVNALSKVLDIVLTKLEKFAQAKTAVNAFNELRKNISVTDNKNKLVSDDDVKNAKTVQFALSSIFGQTYKKLKTLSRVLGINPESINQIESIQKEIKEINTLLDKVGKQDSPEKIITAFKEAGEKIQNVDVYLKELDNTLDKKLSSVSGFIPEIEKDIRQATAVFEEFKKEFNIDDLAPNAINKLISGINTEIKQLGDGIKKSGPFDDLTKNAKDAYDKVVGNSIIPDLVAEVKSYLDKLDDHTRQAMGPMVNEFEKASDKINEEMSKGILNPNTLRSFKVIASQVSDEIETGLSNLDISDSLSGVRGDISRLDNLDFDLTTDLRDEVAKISNTFSSIPDKADESFVRLKNQFSDTKRDATRLTNILEGIYRGDIDSNTENLQEIQEQARKTTIRLSAIQEEADKLKSDNITDLERALQGINEVSGTARQTLTKNASLLERLNIVSGDTASRFRDIRGGVELAFGGRGLGGRLAGVRQALFGLGESSNVVAVAIDKIAGFSVDASVDMGRLAEEAQRLSETNAQVASSMTNQIKIITKLAKARGEDATALANVQRLSRKATDDFNRLNAQIAATGQVDRRQVHQLTQDVQLLNQGLDEVEATGMFKPGSEAFKALQKMRSEVNGVVNSTVNLTARVEDVETKSKGLRGVFNKLFSIFKRDSKETSRNIRETTQRTSKLKTALSGVFKLMSAIARIRLFYKLFNQFNLANRSLNHLRNGLIGLQFLLANTFQRHLIDPLIYGVQNLTREFFRVNTVVEDTEVTLRTMFSGAGLSANETEKSIKGFFDFIKAETAATPFQLDETINAGLRLVQQNFDPEKWFRAAANAAAFGKRPVEQFINALIKLGAGETGDGIRQLRDLGINVREVSGFFDAATGQALSYEEAQKAVNMSAQELASKGIKKLNFEWGKSGELINETQEALNILNAYLLQDAKLANAAAARQQALSGVLSNIKDVFINLATVAGAPLFEKLTILAKEFLVTLEDNLPFLEDLVYFIGVQLGEAVVDAAEAIKNIDYNLKDLAQSVARYVALVRAIFRGDWEKAWDIFDDVAADAVGVLFDSLDGWLGDLFNWGFNLIDEVADGIRDATYSSLLYAVNEAGRLISDFFEPGSPPKEGPLSTIDDWGAPLMEELFKGLKEGDTDFIVDALSPVQDKFLEMFPDPSIFKDKFGAVRQTFAQLVSGINETGEIDTALFDQMVSSLGAGNEELKSLLASQLKLRKVQKKVSDAEESGFVPKELQKELELAELDVAFKEQDFKSAEQLLKEQQRAAEAASRAAVNSKKKELKEKSELQEEANERTYESELELLEKKKAIGLLSEEEYLQARISLEERYAEEALEAGDLGLAKQRAAVANKLQKQLEKIKEDSKEKQVETAKEQYDEELALLQKKFEIGLIDEEEYVQGLLALERKYVEGSLKEGVVAGLDQHIKKIDELEARLQSFGKSDKTFAALRGDFEQSENLLAKKRQLGIIDEKTYLQQLVSLREGYINDIAELSDEALLDVDFNDENLQAFVDQQKEVTSQMQSQLQVLESTNYTKPYEKLLETLKVLDNQIELGAITEDKALDARKSAYKKFIQDVTRINTNISSEEIFSLLRTVGDDVNLADEVVAEYEEQIRTAFDDMAKGIGEDTDTSPGKNLAENFVKDFNDAVNEAAGSDDISFVGALEKELEERLPKSLEDVSKGLENLTVIPHTGPLKLIVDSMISVRDDVLPEVQTRLESIETIINNIKEDLEALGVLGFFREIGTSVTTAGEKIESTSKFVRDLDDNLKGLAAGITFTLLPVLGVALLSNLDNIRAALYSGAGGVSSLIDAIKSMGSKSQGAELVAKRLDLVDDAALAASASSGRLGKVMSGLSKTVGKAGSAFFELGSRISLVFAGPTVSGGFSAVAAAWGTFFASFSSNVAAIAATLASVAGSVASFVAAWFPLIAAVTAVVYGIVTNLDLLSDLWDDLLLRFKDFAEDFISIWENLIGASVEEQVEYVTTTVTSKWDNFLKDLGALGESLTGIFAGAFTGIQGLLVTLLAPPAHLFNSFFALLTGDFNQAKISFTKAIDSFIEGLFTQFEGIGILTGNVANLIIDALFLTPVTILDVLGFSEAAENIRSQRDIIKNAVTFVFEDAFGGVAALFSGDISIEQFFTKAIDRIKGIITDNAISLLTFVGFSEKDVEKATNLINEIFEELQKFLNLDEISALTKEIRDLWNELGNETLAELNTAFGELNKAISDIVTEISDMLAEFLKVNFNIELMDLLIIALKALAILVGLVVVPALAAIIGILSGAANAIKTFLTGLKNIVTGVKSIFEGVIGIVTGFINIITGILTADSEKIKEGLGKVWQGIKDIIWGILSTITGIVQATFGTVISFVQGFVDGVIKVFKSLYNALVGNSIIPDIAAGIIYWLGPNLIKEVISNIKNFVATAIQKFVEFKQAAIQTAIDFVVGFVSESANLIIKISEIIGDVVTTIYGWKDNLITAGTDMLGWFVDGILAAKDYVVDSVNTVLEEIRSRTNFSSPADVGPLNVSIQWDAYLADGITEAKPVVSEKVDDVFNSVLIQTDNFSNNFGEKLGSGMKQGFDAAAAGVFDSLNQFVPNLDELVDKDNPYNKLFSSINDSTAIAEAALASSGQTQIGTTRQYTGEMANVEKTTLQDVLNKWGEVQGKKTGTLAETSTKQTEITKATQDEIVKLSEEANDKIASSNISLFQHFQTLYQRIEEMARAAFRDIAGVVMSATNEQIKAANSLQNAWVRAINNIMSAINRLRQAMRNMPQGPSGRGQGPSGNIGGGRIPQYATGALNIAKDTLAVVHKGETVLPTKIAKPFREFIKSAKDYGLDSVDLTKSRTGAMLNSASNLQTTKVENNTNTFILEAGALSFPNVKDGNGVNSVVQELNKMASMSVARGRVV